MQTLHLKGVKTIDAREVGREIVAHAEVTFEPDRCPECKHKELYAFGTRATRYQDLPMHGEQVLINLKRQRYRCRNPKCKHTFMPAPIYAGYPNFPHAVIHASTHQAWLESLEYCANKSYPPLA